MRDLSLFEEDVRETLAELHEVLVSKQADYGPASINGAPGGPMNGLLVRIHDKYQRLIHLWQQDGDPNHEAVEDTLVDLANYAVIALMVRSGRWPT